MSFPTAKVSGSVAFFHSLLSITPRKRTSADFAFGNSTPTERVPGIGASILILSTAKFNANSLSRAKIFDKFTPWGGFIVYCVTLGPTFAPSISTSIPNSPSVVLIICAFCWISPGLAGDCFFSSKLISGIFQFGSLTATRARSGSGATTSLPPLAGLPAKRVFSGIGSFAGVSSTATPEFTLISKSPPLTFSPFSALRARRSLCLSSRSPVRKIAAIPLNTVNGFVCKMKIAVTNISTT